MNISLSRLIVGLISLMLGIFFVVLAIFTFWFYSIYGVLFLALGIGILLNKGEDKIEKRKDLKEKGYTK